MKHSSRAFNDRITKHPDLRGTTGTIFEEEVTGGIVIGSCHVTATGRLTFCRAIKAVMRGQLSQNQPFDPACPRAEAAVFHAAVVRKMKAAGMNPNGLQQFTALKSALDWYHGTDGFFRYRGKVVTFDATVNPHKTEAERAAVLVRGEDALNGYDQPAWEIAQWLSLSGPRFYDAMRQGKGVVFA